MKPSDIVRMYRVVAATAKRSDFRFDLDRKRLEPGFSQTQIDGIFGELDYIEGVERAIDGRLAHLDALLDGGIDGPYNEPDPYAEIERLRDIARRVTDLPYFKNERVEALVRDAKDALALPSQERS
jgi:hypothetical protein